MPEINVLIEGGKATAGAPLGPALGPTGLNIGGVVAQINEKTKNFVGTKVPVKILVDSAKKSFEIEVGSPPVSALIKKELKIEKGAANPKTETCGNLSFDQVKKIAEMKMENINSYTLFSASREVIGTANSMGVQIEGKNAKAIQKEFDEGKHDAVFGKESVVKGVKKEAKSFVEGITDAAKNILGKKEDTAEKPSEEKNIQEAEKKEEKPVEETEKKEAVKPAEN